MAAGILLFSSGCETKSLTPSPRIAEGSDVCDECGMIINEARFAVAETRTGEQSLKFDSIGCSVHYYKKHSTTGVLWVRDYEKEKWIQTGAAFFVFAPTFVTPMGYGLVAFEDEGAANQFAQSNQGEISKWGGYLKKRGCFPQNLKGDKR